MLNPSRAVVATRPVLSIDERPDRMSCVPHWVANASADRYSPPYNLAPGALAQLGERRLCKPEAAGSSPACSIDARMTAPLTCFPALLASGAGGSLSSDQSPAGRMEGCADASQQATRRSMLARAGLAAGGLGLLAAPGSAQAVTTHFDDMVEVVPPPGIAALRLVCSGSVPQSTSVGGASQPRQQRVERRRRRPLLGPWRRRARPAAGREPGQRANPSSGPDPERRDGDTPFRSSTTRPEAPATRPPRRSTSSRPTSRTPRSGVHGRETGRGTVKITHGKPDGSDDNASALSIALRARAPPARASSSATTRQSDDR